MQQTDNPCRGGADSVSLAACCPPAKISAVYDRFPMGKGHAPGIATGLGVSGAGGSAAGWAARVFGTEDRCWTAGFFLAAFFLADFSVGFFLADARTSFFFAGFFG